MQNFQTRVVDEKTELDEKIGKLNDFLASAITTAFARKKLSKGICFYLPVQFKTMNQNQVK